MNIGFVGVGRMGANMARHLKDRGFRLRRFTTPTARRHRSRAEAWVRGEPTLVGSHGGVGRDLHGSDRRRRDAPNICRCR